MRKSDWSLWETKVSEDFGGKLAPGSGNQWFAKGDVKCGDYAISCKQTNKNSFTIKNDDWKEILTIAITQGKMPLMAVNLNGRKLIVMDYDEFLGTLKESEEHT